MLLDGVAAALTGAIAQSGIAAGGVGTRAAAYGNAFLLISALGIPLLAAALMVVMVERQGDTEERLASMLFRNVESRLAEFLLKAMTRWGGKALVKPVKYSGAGM
ncbi:MAG: hypothetical protein WCK05_10190 [Planctomycetota bacterium]